MGKYWTYYWHQMHAKISYIYLVYRITHTFYRKSTSLITSYDRDLQWKKSVSTEFIIKQFDIYISIDRSIYLSIYLCFYQSIYPPSIDRLVGLSVWFPVYPFKKLYIFINLNISSYLNWYRESVVLTIFVLINKKGVIRFRNLLICTCFIFFCIFFLPLF